MRRNLALETVEVSADVLSSLLESVKQDPAPVVTTVRDNVQRSKQGVNNCMMGGWTS